MIIRDPTLTTLPEFRTRPNSTHSNIVSSMGDGGGGLRERFKTRLFYDCQVVPREGHSMLGGQHGYSEYNLCTIIIYSMFTTYKLIKMHTAHFGSMGPGF